MKESSMRLTTLLPIFADLLSAPLIDAQDWSQWRGPGRNGVVARNSTTWPSTLQQVWRVDVGEGFSSPVTSGTRVFVHSRKDPEEIVTALDQSDGRILWRQ